MMQIKSTVHPVFIFSGYFLLALDLSIVPQLQVLSQKEKKKDKIFGKYTTAIFLNLLPKDPVHLRYFNRIP